PDAPGHREPAAPSPAASSSPSAPARRVPDDRERLGSHGRVILVVEDDPHFAGLLADLARQQNFQCLVTASAQEALELAREHLPSAVLLDVGLPDSSGLFVLDRLKHDARTRHIPVHVVSGSDHMEKAMAMGAVGYMLKPVAREQITGALQSLETQLTRRLRRVLVVEDDPVQLGALCSLLTSREVEPTGAMDAADCLAKLREGTFDCMVLDLSLPDATGFSLLEKISADESYPFPPVIIYTGRELSEDEEQRLRRYSKSIIIKGAKSHERLLDEVALFLHQVVAELPPEQQRMIEKARSREAALEGRRVLLAEDDVRNIFALTSLLEPLGLTLEIARNGREALTALERVQKGQSPPVDLILMDIMMPEMDGLTAMRAIRENPEWRKLPIIALTAKAMPDDQRQCLAAGANDYLAKPLDVEKLLSLVRIWMPR
ncbi:MAG: response regulator, partial [Verrucomicrobiaceae bacterium]